MPLVGIDLIVVVSLCLAHIVVVHRLTSSRSLVDYPCVVTTCGGKMLNERVMLSRIDGE
jgi:hypothetical protein